MNLLKLFLSWTAKKYEMALIFPKRLGDIVSRQDTAKTSKKMKNENLLPFGNSGVVVYKGSGSYKTEDYNVPTFIRRKLGNQKALFKRASNEPAKVLEARY